MKLLSTLLSVTVLLISNNSLFSQATNIFPSTGAAGVGTISPHASCLLEVKSSTKGVLLPRMNKSERDAIASPGKGLLIYQTNSNPGFYYYDGSTWLPVSGLNTSLSNMATPTAINATLLPNADNSLNLGSSSLGWKKIYASSSFHIGSHRVLDISGVGNTFIGNTNNQSNTGSYNTFVGDSAGRSNTSGVYNTATGYQALFANTTGFWNTANGYQALSSNINGYFNVACGKAALYSNISGFQNVAVGNSALYFTTSGGYNTAVGHDALYANSTGSSNSACGNYALFNNTEGGGNSGIGFQALYRNLTGDYNTASGLSALYYNAYGSYNTASGFSSGAFNENNNNCTFYGYDADQSVTTDFTNSMALGANSRINDNNQVRIGNASVTSIGGYADWSDLSDGRFKKNVREDVPGLEFIEALRPITYTMDVTGLRKYLGEDITGKEGKEGYREMSAANKALIEQGIKEKEKIVYTGFIAQEVEEAAKEMNYDFSGVDAPRNENALYGLRYAKFVVPLVKAVQELDLMNKSLQSMNDQLTSKMDEQQKEIDQLKQQMQHFDQSLAECCSNYTTGSSFTPEGGQPVAETPKLEQNVPNPFNENTIINFYLPQSATSAVVKIYSLDGEELKSFSVKQKGYGEISVAGNSLHSGVYVYTLIIDGKAFETRQMILTK